MKPLNTLLDTARLFTRKGMRYLAKGLNTLSNGRVTPNSVTLFALAGHILVAYLIAIGHLRWAALSLVIFGLLDTLDGELARLQGRVSNAGMLLDATTDRIKETLLYSGAAYYLTQSGRPSSAVWAAAACGMSICVSYVKAKGETAISDQHLTPSEKNKLFQDGFLRFEVRMFLLVVGLLAHQLTLSIAIIALLAAFTVFDRLVKISRKLNVQN